MEQIFRKSSNPRRQTRGSDGKRTGRVFHPGLAGVAGFGPPVHQQTQVSSLTFERGESRLSDDDEHHEMGGHNYIAFGGVVPRGEQPGIGSYRRLCLGRPAGQASDPCTKVFLGGGFRSDRCAFQSDRTDCPLWKQHTMVERVGSCNIRAGCSRTEVRT